MKRTRTLHLVTAAVILLAAVFAACSVGNFRDDVSVPDICAKIAAGDAVQDYSSMTAMDDSYITGAMKIDTSLFAEYAVYLNPYGTTIDEFGVFRVAGKDGLKAAQKEIDDYLQLRRDTWMNEYMPEEKPKLDAAVYKTDGNYIMYVILDEESSISALAAFDEALTWPSR